MTQALDTIGDALGDTSRKIAPRTTGFRMGVGEGKRAGMFDHVTLEELRSYRSALRAEDQRMEYWSRLVDARLDELSECDAGLSERDDATPAIDVAGIGTSLVGDADMSWCLRNALAAVLPLHRMPPAPRMDAVTGRADRATMISALSRADAELQRYRRALARRHTLATTELVDRYCTAPDRCLGALVGRPGRGVGRRLPA